MNLKEGALSSELFCDPYFKPEILSLIPSDESDPAYQKTPQNYINDYKSYVWLRLNEIYGMNNYKMFCDKLNPEDINQGNLGSCYFLCALIGLSNFEDRIKKLFVTKEINENGLYGVKILIQGEYQIISVDDFIPCKPIERKPVFGTSSFNEIWLIILEKAWAKVNRGCYMRTWLGTPQEALTCLSEAPCIYEYHPKYIKRGNEISIWENIVYSLNKKYIICADTENLDNPNEIGLVPFHAYSIIKAYDLTSFNLKLL